MEEVKFSIKALAAIKNMSIVELANSCGINPAHLKQVSRGNVTMTASDLVALAKFTGVHPFDILVKK